MLYFSNSLLYKYFSKRTCYYLLYYNEIIIRYFSNYFWNIFFNQILSIKQKVGIFIALISVYLISS